MSRRRRRVAAAVAALLTGAAAGSTAAEAQVPSLSREGQLLRRIEEPVATAPAALPTEAELLRRIDSLVPVLEEARAADSAAQERRRVEEAARPRPVTELVRVGPLQVATLPDQAELASGLFGEVWRELSGWAGGSPALAQHLFVFQWRWRSAEPLQVDPETTGHAALQRVELTRVWARNRAAARARVREAVWRVARSDIPDGSPLGRWIGSHAYPVPERVSRLVVTTDSDAGRACVAGRADACLDALGLSGGERSMPPEAPSMVLLEALRLGGDGAWERLLERSDAEPAEALEHVAGVDLDAVVAAWRTALLEARPEAHAGLGWQTVRTLIWVLALMALAMRSTRWRLG